MRMHRRLGFLCATGGLAAAFVLLATGVGQTEAATKKEGNGPYSFQIVLDGKVYPGFKSVGGLKSETEVVEFKDGDDSITHKRAGKPRYGDITVTRLVGSDPSLHDWFKKVLAGTTDRKSGSVIYLDRAGQEVLRYNFFEAWPCRWKAPELNASSDAHLVEEIEFCVEKIERA